MNTKTFSEAMNEIDDRYLEKALAYRKNAVSGYWLKWGVAAACLSLLAGGFYLIRNSRAVPTPDAELGVALADGGSGSPISDTTGGIGEPALGGEADCPGPSGYFPDGVDPLVASVAVYPPSEKIQDVDTATVNTVDEAAVSALEPFRAHLPKWLPEDFHFRQASLYETTMKDGTTYHMLRITYTNGTQKEIQTFVDEDGNSYAVAPDPAEWGDELTFHMWDFQPNIQQKIYVLDALLKNKLDPDSSVNHKFPFDMADSTSLYLDCGDIYVGVFPQTGLSSEALDPADLVKIICSMQ